MAEEMVKEELEIQTEEPMKMAQEEVQTDLLEAVGESSESETPEEKKEDLDRNMGFYNDL